MNNRFKSGLTLRSLLLVVFLAAQGSVFAHGIDHFNLDDSNCAVCTVGTGLDSSTVEAIESLQTVVGISVPVVRLNACLPEQFPVRKPARGPPALL